MAGCPSCGEFEREQRRSDDAGLHIALAGNPNTGKSSIFNLLTGSHQHVGNWPGKTVSRIAGTFTLDGTEIEVVDLPGTYSLNVSSPEEMIARDYLVSGEPEGVVVVLDASNLERNLYLAIQILEMDIPVVVALNMVDVAGSRGIFVDTESLSRQLGVPVVETIARKGSGIRELKAAVVAMRSLTEAA